MDIINLGHQNEKAFTYPEAQTRQSKMMTWKVGKVLDQIGQEYSSTENASSHRIKPSNNMYSLVLLLQTSDSDFQLSVNLAYDIIKNSLYLESSIFLSNRPYCLQNKGMRLNFLTYSSKLESSSKLFSLCVDQTNGTIKIKNLQTIIVNEIQANMGLPFLLRTRFHSIVEFGKKITKLLTRLSLQSNPASPQTPDHKNRIKIYKYLSLSFLDLGISRSEGERMLESRKVTREQEIKIYHAYEKMKFDDCSIMKSMNLFQLPQDESQINLEICSDESDETSEMRSYLKIPKIKLQNPIYENQFIFNEIELENPGAITLAPTLFKGGTSEIKFFQSRLTYVQGEQKLYQPSIKNNRSMLNKKLLVKLPKDKRMAKYVKHETNIVSSFKSSSSAYFLKYYISKQKGPLKDQLLMDLCAKGTTLKRFFDMNSLSMQLRTKIIMISNIANGLRFLDKKEIAHMDLNMNNILVLPSLLVKIIDFGEAYQKSLCPNGITPGFTCPFGPPEGFTLREFSTKQDIFSLGIILFYLIMERLPFQPTKLVQTYFASKQYPKRLFLAPESLEGSLWQTKAHILLGLINRMINPEVAMRPYPSWVRVITKLVENLPDTFFSSL